MNYLELLKIIFYPARVLFALAVAGWVVLFAPSWLADGLHLSTVRDDFGFIVGPIALILSLLWLAAMWAEFRQYRARRWKRAEVVSHLAHLNNDELFLVTYCLWRRRRTIYLAITDAAGKSLCDKGIMTHSIGPVNQFAIPHTITADAWWGLMAERDARLAELSERVLKEFEDFERGMERRVADGQFARR